MAAASSGDEAPDNEDYYALLNVRREASQEELKAAYRRLCMLYHPDKHRDPELKRQAEQLFNLLHQAYEASEEQEISDGGLASSYPDPLALPQSFCSSNQGQSKGCRQEDDDDNDDIIRTVEPEGTQWTIKSNLLGITLPTSGSRARD